MNERELYQAILEKHPSLIEEIRADERRKFAEWLTHNFVYTHGIGFSRLSFSRKYTVDEVIAEYEKEQKWA